MSDHDDDITLRQILDHAREASDFVGKLARKTFSQTVYGTWLLPVWSRSSGKRLLGLHRKNETNFRRFRGDKSLVFGIY